MSSVDSNGNRLSKEQVIYFKNSKIRDDSGNLLVVYHGTSSDVIDSFNKDRIGERSGKSHLQFGSGFYFTQYSGSASFYGNVFEFYLNICNPYIVNTNGYKEYQDEFILNFKQRLVDDFNLIEFKNNLDNLVGDDIQSVLIDNGYDGIVYGPEYIIAFEPNQIKAITNKKPTNHDNINEAVTEAFIKLSEDFNLEYGDYERPPYNDGDLQRAIYNNTPKEDYYGSVNLDAFFKGWPAGGCVWEDVENAYDYDGGESKYVWRSIKNFKEISDRPKSVRIYRTVPNNVKDDKIHNGDWVTLSKKYAQEHGDLRYTNNYHILTDVTTTDKIWWCGDHICEFGLDDTPIKWK